MKLRSIIAVVNLSAAIAHAQGPIQLSLQQALDMAADQSYVVQASEMEAQKAYAQVKEVTAIGLPQINGSVELNKFVDVPTQLIPNFFDTEAGAPEFIPVQFGVPWSSTAGLTISQLIFDGSYLVGLKAARELRTQSDLDLQKTRADARNQAAKAYYGVLAAEEGVRLIGEGIPLLEQTEKEARAMLDAGFLESTDVDRITIQLQQARAQQRSFQQEAQVARMMLALSLGVPQGTPMELTDDLDKLLKEPGEMALTEQPFDPQSHVEQVQANNMVELQTLNMRNEQSKAIPNLAGFFSHQQVWNGPDFEPFGGPFDWYPTTLWGLTMNVPIFSSGMRHQRVQQARIGLEQVRVNQTATEQRLTAMAEQQRSMTRTAHDNFRTEEQNMALARNIFERTSTKFRLGAASSFELTQEQGNYLLSQQGYVQKLVELLVARADLRNALDLY